MNVILGFGSTEQAFVRDEEAAIQEQIEKLYGEQGASYFSDDLVGQVRAWLKERSDELHRQAAVYKCSTGFPDRYSYYWPTVVADATNIVVILRMHHINRRHALSPDGWALLQERAVFVFDTFDMPRVEEAA